MLRSSAIQLAHGLQIAEPLQLLVTSSFGNKIDGQDLLWHFNQAQGPPPCPTLANLFHHLCSLILHDLTTHVCHYLTSQSFSSLRVCAVPSTPASLPPAHYSWSRNTPCVWLPVIDNHHVVYQSVKTPSHTEYSIPYIAPLHFPDDQLTYWLFFAHE